MMLPPRVGKRPRRARRLTYLLAACGSRARRATPPRRRGGVCTSGRGRVSRASARLSSVQARLPRPVRALRRAQTRQPASPCPSQGPEMLRRALVSRRSTAPAWAPESSAGTLRLGAMGWSQGPRLRLPGRIRARARAAGRCSDRSSARSSEPDAHASESSAVLQPDPAGSGGDAVEESAGDGRPVSRASAPLPAGRRGVWRALARRSARRLAATSELAGDPGRRRARRGLRGRAGGGAAAAPRRCCWRWRRGGPTGPHATAGRRGAAARERSPSPAGWARSSERARRGPSCSGWPGPTCVCWWSKRVPGGSLGRLGESGTEPQRDGRAERSRDGAENPLSHVVQHPLREIPADLGIPDAQGRDHPALRPDRDDDRGRRCC